ncbi:hypothetical protein [Mycolicibacterium cosmeticum]|uniref:hypothetical protein n=1 Tax=Mycolicibacterium cosmeticum TaxID=258533 RepID=UPI0032047356
MSFGVGDDEPMRGAGDGDLAAVMHAVMQWAEQHQVAYKSLICLLLVADVVRATSRGGVRDLHLGHSAQATMIAYQFEDIRRADSGSQRMKPTIPHDCCGR